MRFNFKPFSVYARIAKVLMGTFLNVSINGGKQFNVMRIGSLKRLDARRNISRAAYFYKIVGPDKISFHLQWGSGFTF